MNDFLNDLKQFSLYDLKRFIPNEIVKYIDDSVSMDNLYNYYNTNIESLFRNIEFINCLKKYKNNDIEYNLIYNELNNKSIEYCQKRFLKLYGFNKTEKAEKRLDYCQNLLSKQFYELLDYQFLIKENVVKFIDKQTEQNHYVSKLIIHMPTGTGKTKTTNHLISTLYIKNKNNGSIVWLAHTEELLDQAYKTFTNVWSVLGNDSVRIMYNEVDSIFTDKTIYFLTYQKLISMLKNDLPLYNSLRDNMYLCVCDEAHKCLATETKQAVEKLMLLFDPTKTKILIGLTATPGRKFNDSFLDGENNELAIMFDKHIFSIEVNALAIFDKMEESNIFKEKYDNTYKKDDQIIKYFQDKGILAKIKREPLKYNLKDSKVIFDKFFAKSKKKDFSSKELMEIGETVSRNFVIVNKLIELDKKNIPTIFFACSNEQGKIISDILSIKGIKNFAVFGDTATDIRKQIIKDFNSGKFDILINNMILTTGFDSPRIKCVLISRPTNSIVLYSQMIGRGLRGPKMGGNEECLLIDVIDNITSFPNENEAFNYFSEYWR